MNDFSSPSSLPATDTAAGSTYSISQLEAEEEMEQEDARGVPSHIVVKEPLPEADDDAAAVPAAHHDSPALPVDATDDDFDFAFVIKDPEVGPDITADEIFSNGFIRPIYPVLDRASLRAPEAAEEKASPPRGTLRRLLIEEREEDSGSASSSSTLAEAVDELEGIPEDTYCVWTPGSSTFPASGRCKKSRSTGNSRRWRLRDLVVGRSYSDGKEKFVFLAAAEAKKKRKENTSRVAAAARTKSEKEKATRKEKGKEGEVDAITAHRIYYGRGGSGSGRQTFLPYKQGLLGFFAHTSGLSRAQHLF